jgi:hypothetical protein
MKFKANRQLVIKIGIAIILMIAIPFLPELFLFVDIVGLEMAIAFFTLYLSTGLGSIKAHIQQFKMELRASEKIMLHSHMLKPKIYGAHAFASSCILLLTGSTVLAILLWLPALTMSTRMFGSFT